MVSAPSQQLLVSFINTPSLPLETMVQALTEFVGIPSVTASETHREFCRQAAIWLQASLSQLGAEAFLVRFHHDHIGSAASLTHSSI